MMHRAAIRPPGSYGPPVLGAVLGTLEFFLFGWKRYFTRREKRFTSKIFKVNLFQPTIAVLDSRAMRPLFGDPDFVQDFGFSWAKPPMPLVGGVVPSIFEQGPAHDQPKAWFIELLAERMQDLPAIFDKVASDHFERWTKAGAFKWADAVETFAVDLIFEWLLGARPDSVGVRRIYNHIFLHFFPSLERLLPSSNYSKSLKDYKNLVNFIRRVPRYRELCEKAARHGVPEGDCAHRLAFLLGMNGFLGVQSLMKSLIGEMSRHEGLKDIIRQETLPEGSGGPPSMARMFVRETLRLHPPVFFIFGRATQPRLLKVGSDRFEIRRNDLVMGVIPLAQTDPALFEQPDTFKPDRHASTGPQEWLIWPRGLHDAMVDKGDRSCPGKDHALVIAEMFCKRLAEYIWRLKSPPLWTSARYSLNVAAPEGELDVEGFGRRR